MKIYGLVGKSGTGKSFHAMRVCRDKSIEAIVDDGLFIYGTGIQAGISAKRQATKIGAIKTALFTDVAHCTAVREKIQEMQPASILVLGTSTAMILRILERLALPPLAELISIEDITTEQERQFAKKQRQDFGKHVIPAPTFQVKRQFSGYFLDPLRMLRGLGRGGGMSEKTVVRPTYSYLGDYVISEQVILDIVLHTVSCTPDVFSVLRTSMDNRDEGLSLRILIYGRLGTQIIEVATAFQRAVAKEVEQMTAFNILKVDVEIRGLK